MVFHQRRVSSSVDQPGKVVDWPARRAMIRQVLDADTSTSAAITPKSTVSACRPFPTTRKDESRRLNDDLTMQC